VAARIDPVSHEPATLTRASVRECPLRLRQSSERPYFSAAHARIPSSTSTPSARRPSAAARAPNPMPPRWAAWTAVHASTRPAPDRMSNPAEKETSAPQTTPRRRSTHPKSSPPALTQSRIRTGIRTILVCTVSVVVWPGPPCRNVIGAFDLRRDDGWRGASPARGGPRETRRAGLTSLEYATKLGWGLVIGLGGCCRVQFWRVGVQGPCKSAGLHLRQQGE
jgi:hypothetical protein